MESIKMYIIVPVNGIPQKVYILCLLMESIKEYIIVSVNRFIQNVNISVC